MVKKAQKRTRATNGMGSIRLRPDGRWEARYTSPNGQQKSVYGKSEKEVAFKLRNQLHEIDSGVWREPSRMSVDDWLTIWLRDYQTHTTERTIRTYGSVVRTRVIPLIGSVRMSNLSSVHVRRVISDMSKNGLSASYIKQCKQIMSAAFSSAVESGILRTNPTAGIKTPRAIKKRLTIIDRDLFPQFIAACKRHKHGLAFIFLLLTGLRAGEERGLCWADVNFETSSIHIRHQIPMVGTIAFSPPKDGSVRTIELPPEAMSLLRQQKKDLAAMKIAAGTRWYDDEITNDLVFRSTYGRALGRVSMHKAIKSIGAEIGLPGLHAHDLRHSYAVAALRSGIDVKTVQNNMGHKNAAVTLDIYAAYTNDAGRAGAVKFSTYWQDALREN